MEWKFYIDSEEIDEPIGFNGFVYKLIRDDRYHGVFFEASANTLTFIGEAASIITEAKESIGIDANLIFRAEYRCEGSSEYLTGLEGRVNIGTYERTCGDDCRVKVSIEQETCAMTFKNRISQKVALDSTKSMGGVDLQPYTGLNYNLTLPTQEVPIRTDANVSDEGDSGVEENTTISEGIRTNTVRFRPDYMVVRDSSIIESSMDNAYGLIEDVKRYIYLTPQVLMDEMGECIPDPFTYEIRMKGNFLWDFKGGNKPTLDLYLRVNLWNGDLDVDRVEVHSTLIQSSINDSQTYTFDETYSGTIVIPEGWGFYAYLEVYCTSSFLASNNDFFYTFDKETSFLMYNIKKCPPTEAGVYMVNETLSRLTEIITDRCLLVKSEYYGRTDSHPYSHDSDGCGSLRAVTNGLKIRQAEEKEYFTSFNDIFEGLKAIDNIGMGIFQNDVRVEPVEFFYQDTEILRIPNIPTITTEYDERKVYSLIKIGYRTWEAEEIKGILEFNSNKEFRTSVKSVDNTIEAISTLIASGSIIESIRFQVLLDTGEKDNSFDNENFIFCLKRTAYGYEVEQGIIENDENVVNASTAYNWRIRPIYNLMRWFKTLANSYVNLLNTDSKLYFNSGTGNYTAGGMISIYDGCSLENQKLYENSDIDVTKYKEMVVPIYGPDIVKFSHPLSVEEYKAITENPYGYISVQCGSGDFQKCFLKEIQYNISTSMANFTLIK